MKRYVFLFLFPFITLVLYILSYQRKLGPERTAWVTVADARSC